MAKAYLCAIKFYVQLKRYFMKLKTLSTVLLRLTMISCMLFLLDVGIKAQGSQTIRGTVIDASTREPMIGVSVMEQGTRNGAVTGLDGNYVLQHVKPGATIRFSYVGFKDITLPAAKASGEVIMEEDDKTLTEVVVVGYGTQKKVNSG